jgi:hypothetical protein
MKTLTLAEVITDMREVCRDDGHQDEDSFECREKCWDSQAANTLDLFHDRVDEAIGKLAIAGNLAQLYDGQIAQMIFSVARLLKGERSPKDKDVWE